MKQLYITVIVIVTLLAGCTASKQAVAQQPEPTILQQKRDDINNILAVILKATSDIDGSINFEIYKATKNPGKLKPTQQQDTGTDYIICFANDQQDCIATYHVKNPLIERLEHPGEDHLSINKAEHRKQEGYINLRVNYSSNIQYVVIMDNNGKKLFTLSLKNIH